MFTPGPIPNSFKTLTVGIAGTSVDSGVSTLGSSSAGIAFGAATGAKRVSLSGYGLPLGCSVFGSVG